MRLFPLSLIILFSGISLHAADTGSIDQQLYEALTAKEVNRAPKGSVGGVKLEKSAGGLVCTMSHAVVPNPKKKYKCELTGGDDNALYDALNVKERDVTPKGLAGSRHTEKIVGQEFLCTRHTPVVPKPVAKTKCGFVNQAGKEKAADDPEAKAGT